MRKVFILFSAILSLSLCANAQSSKHYTVEQSDYAGVKIHFTTGALTQQPYKYGADTYAMLGMEGFTEGGVIGQPALPVLVKIVEVPLGGAVSCRVDAAVYDTISGTLLGVGHAVMPRQPSRSKSDHSTFVLSKDAQAYATDAYMGSEAVRVHEIGVARDCHLAEIYFSPLRYNPVTNQFIVCRSMEVTVQVAHADAAATEQMKQRYHSGAFGMSAEVINSIGSAKAVSTAAPLRYLIVSDTLFEGQLDSFVQWKRRQGLMVDVAYSHGSTMAADGTTSIKNYIKQQYTAATAARPAPTYVLLVGDVEQIPAANTYTGSDSYISDLEYFTWTEGDNLPDCYYGRFSAQTIAQLTPQIEKTMMYEQYSFPSDTFLTRAALIAGEDGGYSSDNAYRYADPAMDYIAKNYVSQANGFGDILYYKNNTGDVPANVSVTGSCSSTSTPAALRSFYNGGFGWVNYSAHGDITEWYKPSLTNTNVNAMTNQYKFGIMIGNCCLTNHFQTATCFGEALLRKGDYEGAAAYIGASTYSYWYEDFAWAVGMRNSSLVSNTYDATYDSTNMGVYDRLFHTHGEAFGQWHTTLGSMIAAGNMAVQASSSSLKEYYWQVYHLMGDPSMMPWLGQASDMEVSSLPIVTPGTTTYSATVPPYAYVALTTGDSLIAAAFADAEGNATLSFAALTAGQPLELAVTAQNRKPYFSTLSVVNPNGPYVLVDSLVCSTGLQAGDTASFSLYLSNIGTATATDLAVSIAVDGNRLLLLTPATAAIEGGLAAAATVARTAAARTYVWPAAANGTATTVTVTATWRDGDSLNSSTFRIRPTIAAPALSATLSGSNQIAAGSTVTLTVNNSNGGSLPLGTATATLTSPTPNLTVTPAAVTMANGLAAGATTTTQYELNVGTDLPANCVIPLDYILSDGIFSYHTTIEVQMGSTTEDFETGSFTHLAWTQDATRPWAMDSTTLHGGRFAARSYPYASGDGHGETSALTLQWTSMADDSISFWRKVSSESGYDLFHFSIDGTAMSAADASGNGSWERLAFPVAAGTHTFVFSYEKDYSSSYYDDCAWIDDVELPVSSTFRFLFDTICQGENYSVADTTLNTGSLSAGNHAISFAKANLTYCVDLTVKALPQVAITASPAAEEYAAGSNVVLTATGAERYVWASGEEVPQLALTVRGNKTYAVQGYNGRCSMGATIRIRMDGDTSVGLSEAHAPSLLLYPNPTTAVLHVAGSAAIRSAAVYDVQGRLLQQQEMQAEGGAVDCSQLSAGIYMVRLVMADGSIQTRKIVKK